MNFSQNEEEKHVNESSRSTLTEIWTKLSTVIADATESDLAINRGLKVS